MDEEQIQQTQQIDSTDDTKSFTQALTDFSDKGNNPTKEEPEATKKADGETDGGDKGTEKNKSFPTWTSQLNDEMKANDSFMDAIKDFAKLSDFAKAFNDLRGMKEKSVVIPQADADSKEVQSFYQKLGKPENKSGYGISKDGDIDFSQLAFDNNLTKQQAKNIYDAFCSYSKEFEKSQKIAAEKQIKDTVSNLKAEYGADYDAKIELLKRGLSSYGGQEMGKLLSDAGLLYNPLIARHFIALGELSAESKNFNKADSGANYTSVYNGGLMKF